MRRLAVFLLLLSVGGPLLGGETKPGPGERQGPKSPRKQALRISVALDSVNDKQAMPVNLLQWFVYERLTHFRLRVDSLRPIGDKRLKKYVKKITKFDAEKDPDAPPASLLLTGRQTSVYNGSLFYGEAQAHNYKGRVEAQLKTKTGQTLGTFSFSFSWGKSVHDATKSEVKATFDRTMGSVLGLAVLSHKVVRDGVPHFKRKALDKYLQTERDKLLGRLRRKSQATRKGELARFLAGLPIPKTERVPEGGQKTPSSQPASKPAGGK